MQALATNIHSIFPKVIDDYQKTAEWQVAQSIHSSGLLKTGPSQEAINEVQEMRTRMAQMEKAHAKEIAVKDKQIAGLQNAVSFYKYSNEHLDKRLTESEQALQQPMELTRRLTTCLKPQASEEQLAAFTGSVENIMINPQGPTSS